MINYYFVNLINIQPWMSSCNLDHIVLHRSIFCEDEFIDKSNFLNLQSN